MNITSSTQTGSFASHESALVFPLSALHNVIFSLSPDTISLVSLIGFLIACLQYVGVIYNKTKLTYSPYLLGAKLSALICLVSAEAIIASGRSNASESQQYSMASLMPCLTMPILTAAIILDHFYNTGSVAVISISLTATLVSDYSAYSLQQAQTVTSFASSCKLVLLVLCELPKQLAQLLSCESPSKDPSEEREACQYGPPGFWSRSLFICFSTRSGSPLNNVLPLKLSPDSISTEFKMRWSSIDTETRFCLLRTIIQTLAGPLTVIISLKVFLSLFTLSQATLLIRTLAFFGGSDNTTAGKLGLLGIGAFIYSGISICRNLFNGVRGSATEKMQVALETTAHAKLISLRHCTVHNPETIALFNTDVENIIDNIVSVFCVIGELIEMIAYGWLLWQKAGYIATLTQIVIISYTTFDRHIRDNIDAHLQALNESIAARIADASIMLSRIKFIQRTGMINAASSQHEQFSSVEMKHAKLFWDAITKQIRNSTISYYAAVPFILGALHFRGGKTTAQDALAILLTAYLHFEALRKSWRVLSNAKSIVARLDRTQHFLFTEKQSTLSDVEEHSETALVANSGVATAARRAAQRSYEFQPSKAPISSPCSTEDLVVDIQTASLTMDSLENEPILTNLTLSIRRHELVMVAGPLASNKAALLRSLVNDDFLQASKFYREPGTAGYCDRNPWLLHMSIRQNIIGHQPFDLDWYNAVLHACLLTEDMYTFPSGDQTILGTVTSQLSDGQEHRVALARALYMRPEFLILDGVFIALDSITSSKVFSRIFDEGGILEESPSTVVLTTHSRTLLAKADKVVLLDADGSSTVHSDVNSASFHQHLATIRLEEDEETESEERLSKDITYPLPIYEQTCDEGSSDSSSLVQIYACLYCFKSRDVAKFTGLLLISGLGVSFREYLIHIWLSTASGSTLFFVGYIVFTITTAMAMIYAVRLWYMEVSPRAVNELYKLLLYYTLRAKPCYLSNTSHASLLSLYRSDMRSIAHSMPHAFMSIIHDTITATMHIALIINLTEWCSIVLCFLAIGMLVAATSYTRSAQHIQVAIAQQKAVRDASVLETVSGLRHIKAFGWQSHTLQKNISLLQASQDDVSDMLSANRHLELTMDLTKGSSTISMLAFMLFGQNKPSVSIAGVLMIILVLCNDNFVLLTQNLIFIRSCLASFDRVCRALVSMQSKKKALISIEGLPKRWPVAGNILFQNVTASYNAKTLRPALRTTSISIEAGYKIVVVGQSGSGKSSFLLSLLDFLDIKGSICIDNTDITKLPTEFLRQRITMISTHVIELQGTVRSNLCPWTMNMASQEDNNGDLQISSIYLVLTSLRLWDVLTRQGGLDKEMSSLRLTTEQRKLVSVARGMLQNIFIGGRIAIMDDVANDLDPQTEIIVHNTLKEVFDNHTIIRVTSRPDTLDDFDVMIRMIDGRIGEMTTNPNGPAVKKALRQKSRLAWHRRMTDAARQRASGVQMALTDTRPGAHAGPSTEVSPDNVYRREILQRYETQVSPGPHDEEAEQLYREVPVWRAAGRN